jgi:hypothetical protein
MWLLLCAFAISNVVELAKYPRSRLEAVMGVPLSSYMLYASHDEKLLTPALRTA